MSERDPVADPAPSVGAASASRRGTRSEAFVWLTILGLLLLWSTLPIAIALSGWFDCVGSDPTCLEAVERANLVAAIGRGVLVAFTILAVASIVVGRRRLPRILLVMSVAALLFGLTSLVARGTNSPWLPVGLWLTIPATSLLAIGSARQVRWYARQS